MAIPGVDKAPIKMIKFIEELVELATSTDHVLRFKCLKPQEMENGKARITPWILQLPLREERAPDGTDQQLNSTLIQTRTTPN